MLHSPKNNRFLSKIIIRQANNSLFEVVNAYTNHIN